MALSNFIFFTFSLTLFVSLSSQTKLSPNYYKKTCPNFDKIVAETVENKQINSPTTAAAALRLMFHDCLVTGCDASVLISSTPFNKAERDNEINLSLPGDGFDVVVRAKTALELACPGVVSCSDILTVAVRDLVVMMGGPKFDVLLGRRDATVSQAASVTGHVPQPTMSMTGLIKLFASKGFTIQEMVALTGAHTIGFSHCKEFSTNIYNFSRKSASDPNYNPRFADGLRRACSDFRKNPSLSVFNDIMTPSKFDNSYYQNLPKGLGLLSSDRAMNSDWRTKNYVALYAGNQTAFFQAFSLAMQKLSVRAVKTGQDGEIRRRCDAIN